jgi:4-amino-4-deoxy-L-arabinose transferase-like glycosyltransferase
MSQGSSDNTPSISAQRSLRSLVRSPYLWLTLATVASLLPFIDKAFHIDDPLFLWTARHIQAHPVDFYGFYVNWYWSEMPMAEVTKNPPLAAYYIALVASLFGWSEIVLHSAFLVWPVGVVLGTYELAQEFGTRPVLAALAALCTPVFLVSSTSVMSDTMMLCFWTWAMVLWMRGLAQNRLLLLCLSGVLISLSALTKYFGMSLIPLLLVYSLTQERRFGRWLLALLIPVAVLAGYQWATHELYGRGLLLDAAAYAAEFRGQFNQPTQQWYSKPLVGLAFAGGCLFSAFCFAPLLWTRDGIWAGLGLMAALIWAVSSIDRIGVYPLRDEFGVRWPVVIQIVICAVAGISLLALTLADLANHRDARSLFLFLWLVGTFVFATFVNWTINGRSMLPMVPAAGILVSRRIDRMQTRKNGTMRLAWPLIPAAVVGFAVAWSDCRLANSVKEAVKILHEKLPIGDGMVWFQGHWGFQYYMEEQGDHILDRERSPVERGDFLVLPRFNTYVAVEPNSDPALKRLGMQLADRVYPAGCPWLATMNREMGAGFYSTEGFGPLPFAFGPAPPEEYVTVRFTAPNTH